MRIIIRYFNWCLKILIHFQIQILHVWKNFNQKYRKLEHHNSQNSHYLRFGGENGILANQLSKILKSPLLIFVIKIPKSPLKFIFLKRSPKSGEKRMVIFGGENGISLIQILIVGWKGHSHPVIGTLLTFEDYDSVWIQYVFIIFFANFLWIHDLFCEITINSLYILRIYYGSIIFFVFLLWSDYLSRGITMNSLYV